MSYPSTEPYNEGRLRVSELHELYYMQCGNPQGKPVVFLHGGPGGDVSSKDMMFFSPELYRVVLFTQRGAGKSTPTGELRENTTWDLVEDIEKLRKHLEIDRWVVFGGSWGSTLALAYSQTHPTQVKALCLRGIYCIREKESEFLWLTGTKHFFPEEWEAFAEPIPISERGSMQSFGKAYQALFQNPDDKISLKAAQTWSRYESQVSRLRPDAESIAKADNDLTWARAFAQIECHYALNHGFMPDGHLLTEAQIAKIRHLPCQVVQGRYDVVCPPFTAYDLKKVYGKNLTLTLIDDAGHSGRESGTAKALQKAMDGFAEL